ncbi:MAG: hypothetical protein ACLT1B_02775 [Anaerobutyricum hallii]
MRTPAAYNNNLKNHIITMQMLVDCLYSSNKRAKNWRDKQSDYFCRRKYCGMYDKYGNEGNAREKKEEYYHQKEVMLSVLNPICIHKEHLRDDYAKERIYDYEDEYWEYKDKGIFIHTGSYYDKELRQEVEFGDIIAEVFPVYKYYLFYDVGSSHTFHTPIKEEDVSKYDLPVVEIDKLDTKGYDIADLLSNQFVKKVIELIKSEDFELVENI